MSQETQELEQKPVQFGVPGRPYPMVHKEQKRGSITTELGVVEDENNPLTVYSVRDPKEVLGMAYRSMPTPVMLETFKKSLQLRAPDSKRKVQFLIGSAGAGKSFLADLIGNMRDPRGPIIVDCGKKRNLDELKFETVIDLDTSKALVDLVDQRLREGTIKPASIALLKKLDKHFSQEGERISIDWAGAAEQDGDNLLQVLDKVKVIEGLDKADGTQLGFKTREGALIRAWKEGREIILDEYNKSEPGSDAGLQLFWQMMTGEIDKYVATGGAGQSYTFHRKDMKPGFFVTLTGNMGKDGITTRQLDSSSYQRLRPDFVNDPQEVDYQHRWCQARTGVPISTLYHVSEQHWKKNPEDFTKFLHTIRKLGLSKEAQTKIPAHQLERIDNWENELQAADRAARFYHGLAQLLDPESPKYRKGECIELAAEVDEHFSKLLGVGLRMMLDHIHQADSVIPQSIARDKSAGFDIGSFMTPENVATAAKEEVNLNNGTRFTGLVLNELFDKTHDKPNVRKHSMKLATDCGFCEPDLKEAKKSDAKMMSELMNIDIMKGQSLPQQATMVRDLLCDLLRTKYPDLSTDNDDLIATAQVERALREVQAGKHEPINHRASKVHVPNSDLDELSTHPFAQVIAHDSTPETGRSATRVPKEKLADHDGLMLALSIPAMRDINLAGLWNKALVNAGDQGAHYTGDADLDEPMRMALRDKSRSNISTTTVVCQKNNGGTTEEAVVHVFRDDKADKTIVIGEKLDPKLSRLMQRAGIVYVDGSRPNAAAVAQKSIKDLLDDKPPEVEDDLRMAFLTRNSLKGLANSKDLSLGELVAGQTTTCTVPNYITELRTIEDMAHFSRELDKTSGGAEVAGGKL